MHPRKSIKFIPKSGANFSSDRIFLSLTFHDGLLLTIWKQSARVFTEGPVVIEINEKEEGGDRTNEERPNGAAWKKAEEEEEEEGSVLLTGVASERYHSRPHLLLVP